MNIRNTTTHPTIKEHQKGALMTMVDMYPMVHPLTFIQYPIIQYIANDKRWTVSDTNKRPINAKELLESGNIYGARDESELVTLYELDNNPNLQAVNRTYRLQARHNNVIMIDVEPEASNELKNQAFYFPAHYTELSTNGGVHLLIAVPQDLINDENRYLFEELSVFKEPVPKEENRPSYFEVLFNDHYITFTKRAIIDKASVDYNTNPQAKQQLANFLNNIVQLDKERKEKRELAKSYQIDMFEESISKEKKEQIQKFINIRHLDPVKQRAIERDIGMYNEDLSRYEMAVATGIVGGVLRTSNLARTTITYRDMLSTFTEQDYVYASYLIMKDIIPYRDKHEEYRDGLPWLMYICREAYTYVISQQKTNRK